MARIETDEQTVVEKSSPELDTHEATVFDQSSPKLDASDGSLPDSGRVVGSTVLDDLDGATNPTDQLNDLTAAGTVEVSSDHADLAEALGSAEDAAAVDVALQEDTICDVVETLDVAG